MGLDVLGNQNHWVIRLYEAIYILYTYSQYTYPIPKGHKNHKSSISPVYKSHPLIFRTPSSPKPVPLDWKKTVAGLNQPDFSRMEGNIDSLKWAEFVVHAHHHGYLPS
jgi:hypothetical protein